MKPLILNFWFWVLVSCATPSADPSQSARLQSRPIEQSQENRIDQNPMDLWKKTESLEDWEQIRKNAEKPIIVYWGASWCPPCNELKDRVFSNPLFREATLPFELVYLDGDQTQAQELGERFKASGYPTLIILTKAGEEIARANTSMDVEDFQSFKGPCFYFNCSNLFDTVRIV